MPANASHTPVLHDHLTEPPRLGDPDVHGPLAVFPLFGPEPRLATAPRLRSSLFHAPVQS